MANMQTTNEVSVSKTKEEIIKEAKRIEETLLFSSKGHFVAANIWSHAHLFIGIPMVLLSAIAGASALSKFDPDHLIAGILSIIVAAFSGVMTFLNPREISGTHLNAGNQYDSLMNKVRIFWSIDCWENGDDVTLTKILKDFADQKDQLNSSCPQVPTWAYKLARRQIKDGQASYSIDLPPGASR